MKFRSLIAGLALLACSALAQDNEAGSPQPEDPLAAYPNCAVCHSPPIHMSYDAVLH